MGWSSSCGADEGWGGEVLMVVDDPGDEALLLWLSFLAGLQSSRMCWRYFVWNFGSDVNLFLQNFLFCLLYSCDDDSCLMIVVALTFED